MDKKIQSDLRICHGNLLHFILVTNLKMFMLETFPIYEKIHNLKFGGEKTLRSYAQC